MKEQNNNIRKIKMDNKEIFGNQSEQIRNNNRNIYNINNNFNKKNKKKSILWILIKVISIFLFFSSGLFYFLTLSPEKQNKYVVIEVKNGDSASVLSSKLKQNDLIKSEIVFKIISRLKNINKNIHVGKYKITPGDSVFDIIGKIKEGDIIDESISFTILEGWPNYKIAEKLEKKLSIDGGKFSKEKFLKIAKNKEGFLYPDTYKINPEWNEEQIISLFYGNYNKKIKKYLPYFNNDLKRVGKTEKEIITMASIIEAEAGNASQEDKKKVSGVLWNRIEKGMPLQVDAVFSYIKQAHIKEVLFDNLKVKSEYNLYKHKGLPPTPIGNPGLASIRGALNKEKSNFLFYITGKDSRFYYAVSYDEHLFNVKKYITDMK